MGPHGEQNFKTVFPSFHPASESGKHYDKYVGKIQTIIVFFFSNLPNTNIKSVCPHFDIFLQWPIQRETFQNVFSTIVFIRFRQKVIKAW